MVNNLRYACCFFVFFLFFFLGGGESFYGSIRSFSRVPGDAKPSENQV